MLVTNGAPVCRLKDFSAKAMLFPLVGLRVWLRFGYQKFRNLEVE